MTDSALINKIILLHKANWYAVDIAAELQCSKSHVYEVLRRRFMEPRRKNNTRATISTTVRINAPARVALDHLATARNVTRSQLINTAIERFLSEEAEP